MAGGADKGRTQKQIIFADFLYANPFLHCVSGCLPCYQQQLFRKK